MSIYVSKYLIYCGLCIHAILNSTNDTSKGRNSNENHSGNFIVIKFRDAFDDTEKDKLHDGENGNDDGKSDKEETFDKVTHETDFWREGPNPHSQNIYTQNEGDVEN